MEEKDFSHMSSQLHDWSASLEAFLEELRQRTFLLMLPAFIGAAILLGFSISPTFNVDDANQRITIALLLMALIGAVWLVRRWSYPAAVLLLTLGSLAVILRIANLAEMRSAISLIALPVALSTVLVSRKAGAVMAAACTALVWFSPPTLLISSSTERGIALVIAWSVFGMLCVVLSPLVTATSWAWSGYQQSLTLLKQVRSYQEQYHSTMSDLSDVNSQLMRLNQHAHKLRLLAEEERRIKEQFVANISHELRTPLNMILGFSEMILKAPENYSWDFPPKLLADLDVIQRNSQHLSELVDDVLDLSQIEAGRMALTKEYVALGELVQSAVVAVRHMFESKRLTLDVDLQPDLPLIFCDRTRIREVLLNLLSNAGRFTETGGVRVYARLEGQDVIVSVQDTGSGISREDQTRLFQPFQQADNTLRRQHRGTGLGLSLSKSFVELHDGKMWLESEKGRGTTVFFRLPVEPRAPITQSAAGRLIEGWEFYQRTHRSQAPVVPVKPKLVVVENGQSLKSLLTRHLDNFEVVAADNLQQAVEDLNAQPAQALLINQPAGSDIREALQKSADLPLGVPTLICNMPDAQHAANQMGVENYLVKPIQREKLLEALDRLGNEIKTVLVADDDPDALQLFRRMLDGAGRGYRVLRATDGSQALKIMRSEKVDAALLDLMMPEMTGFEVLAARSVDPALQKIPVILISARDPWGQPIVSSSLTVTCRDGLGVQDLLSCIETLSAILSRAKPAANQPPGSEQPEEFLV